ncbi:MAG: efflux RND transporter periplasmic adaptor subunit [Rhodocyclaceae bacterium]|jgi:RND family efflux transporter MFP subunit|nr:efflux RND transporter periplasmic adaptor subunit [Rhodocyclaceae bacterium]
MKPIHRLFALALVFVPALLAAQEKAALVNLREVDQTWPADATVDAVKQATLAAQVAGRIVAVQVDAGTRVRAGETLMRIDSREAAQADAASRAQLVQAQAQYERTRSLLEKKFVSAAAMDRAEADYKAAQAQAAQAGAGLSHATIGAPFAGVVGQRLAELGDMAVPGKPLLTVYDPRGLRAVATVPQRVLEAVRGNLKAWIEFPESGRRIAAERVELLPMLDAQTRTATVRAYLPAGIEGVSPGMFARIHLAIGRASKLLLPPTAVIRRGEVTLVYVLDDKNLAHLRQVRLGEPSADGIEVLAGLKPGERISLDPVQAGIAATRKP